MATTCCIRAPDSSRRPWLSRRLASTCDPEAAHLKQLQPLAALRLQRTGTPLDPTRPQAVERTRTGSWSRAPSQELLEEEASVGL